jgi:DNA-directed RNA polymerase specialized sigma24 family protein
LQELPARYRISLVVHEYHGLTNREIGDVIGVREPAAKSLLHRARQQFNSAMRGYYSS